MEFDLEEAMAALTRTPAALKAMLGGLPRNWTENNEGPETWSPYDVIGHLIHGERVDWISRAKIILEHGEARPFDPFDRFAQFEESKGKTLEDLLDEFAALRERNLAALLAHSVPAKPLRKMGAEKVIAIYFNAHWVKQGGPKHVLDVIGQCFSIAQANMACLWQAEADLLIEPDVAPFSFDAFERAADIIRTGEEAARIALPAIKAWLPEEAPAQTLKPTAAAQPSPVQLA